MEKNKKDIDEKKDINNLFGIFEHPIKIDDDVEEVLEKEVKKFSNTGGHVIIPAKHIGKIARVLIKRKKEEDNK